jgi:uncharacterized DUF497 family protein/predicted DNA binding CopG/RHH family protein
MQKFDWDQANIRHIAEHDVSPDEAEQVIRNEPFEIDFQRYEEEDRTSELGETNSGRILVVVSTTRGSAIRVVTAYAPAKAKPLMLKLPKFANEAEEARWWFENQDLLAEEFHRAAANGTLKRGTAMRRALEFESGSEAASTVKLDPSDISKARALAQKRGLDYQAYLQALIHEALEREEKLAS